MVTTSPLEFGAVASRNAPRAATAQYSDSREESNRTLAPVRATWNLALAAGSDGRGFAATAATKAETSYGTSLAVGVEACVPSGLTVK